MRRIVCIRYILPPLAVSMLLSGDSHCGSSCGGGSVGKDGGWWWWWWWKVVRGEG